MLLKLVSFKACPFVQRVTIALEAKGLDYDIEYIDLAAPPDWFLAISPLKKVPLLIVENQVIFESSVINEYIDEAYPTNKLHPDDLLLKAQNKSWIEFSSNLSLHTFQLTIKQTKREFEETLGMLLNDFDQVEKQLVDKPFFNGEYFSLVDASFAPIFQRLDYMHKLHGKVFDKKRHPHIFKWQKKLLSMDEIKRSCVAEIEDIYHKLLWTRQGYISQFLSEDDYGERPKRSVY